MEATELSPAKRAFRNTIYISGAFKQEGGYTLKIHERYPDAPKSPYYISMREKDVKSGWFLPLCNSLAWAISEDTKHLLDQVDFIIGIPKAGEPIAEAFSRLTKKPILTMEKEVSQVGRRISSVIHGEFQKGQRVLGLDDLVTGADTNFEFIEGVEANGLILVHIAVGLDREQGGLEKLRKAGVSISTALSISRMLADYREQRKVTEEKYVEILTFPSKLNAYIASQTA